jgi:hypothetical protein
LLDNGFSVDLIGSDGVTLPEQLRADSAFQMHNMTPVMQRQLQQPNHPDVAAWLAWPCA